jgi:hypothetical protein
MKNTFADSLWVILYQAGVEEKCTLTNDSLEQKEPQTSGMNLL